MKYNEVSLAPGGITALNLTNWLVKPTVKARADGAPLITVRIAKQFEDETIRSSFRGGPGRVLFYRVFAESFPPDRKQLIAEADVTVEVLIPPEYMGAIQVEQAQG